MSPPHHHHHHHRRFELDDAVNMFGLHLEAIESIKQPSIMRQIISKHSIKSASRALPQHHTGHAMPNVDSNTATRHQTISVIRNHHPATESVRRTTGSAAAALTVTANYTQRSAELVVKIGRWQ